MNQEKTFLDKDEHQEQIQEFNKKLAEDLKEQKQKEKEQGELSAERRRWFNQQIEKYQDQ